jgi:MoaE-MoaD fusion protein
VTIRVLFFAHLRERCGVRETVLELPAGARVEEARTELRHRYEGLGGEPLRVAVNQVYVDNTHPLRDNDELALIPPVSGGAPGDERSRAVYRVTDEAIDAAALLSAVADPRAGASVLFVGSTRQDNEGRVVERLEYEAYREMAGAEMAAIGDDIARRWPVIAVAMVHRLGVVVVGEVSVAVAVSAPHRAEAFAACRYGIDTLKARVPIWKKEHYQGGAVWIGGCHEHAAAREQG